MIFPTNQRWKDLERSTKISFLLVVLIFLAVSTVGYFRLGPMEKDRQVYAWASSFVELGLKESRGHSLSSVGILTGASLGECQAYIMAPPLYHLVLAGIFSISGQDWQALRLGTILYGLIFLYACLALAVKFFQGGQRSWLLFFSLTPMVLIFSTWNDTYGTAMGFLVISFLCFTNFLESGESRWGVWSGAFYVLAFWHSYISISIVPAMLLLVLFHPGLTRRPFCSPSGSRPMVFQSHGHALFKLPPRPGPRRHIFTGGLFDQAGGPLYYTLHTYQPFPGWLGLYPRPIQVAQA
jgi:uncharacterized membrane protein YhaH (DUF805 family)